MFIYIYIRTTRRISRIEWWNNNNIKYRTYYAENDFSIINDGKRGDFSLIRPTLTYV